MVKVPKRAEKEKVQPRLSPLMHQYLEDLLATNLYGDTKTEIAKTLIEDGIKRAIADRHIDVRKERKRKVIETKQ